MTEKNNTATKSKSQVKREMQALRDLGKELVDLPAAELAKFELSESLLDAIALAQHSKREALRRQLQHIGKLLRDEDETAIRRTMVQISQPKKDEIKAFHELEQWRDRLITGDDEVINRLISRFPDADRQHLRQLVRNARRERKMEKPPKYSRLLFQYLKQLQNT